MNMATLQNAPPWANMPLPAGWEAKYEPRLGRYFYINHLNKKTQWTDPRQQAYEAQQRAAPVQPHIPLALIVKPKCRTCNRNEVDTTGGTCGACKLDQQQREIALMRAREEMEEEKRRQEQQVKLEKERERRRVQSARRREERQAQVEETAFNDPPPVNKDALRTELGKMFTKTDASVVDMILETCNWDKERTVNTLVSMGEKKTSPKKTTAAASSSSASPKLTETQKKQMKARLKKAFPHASELMVTMAMETTKFHEQKAKMVLGMLQGEEAQKTGRGSAEGSGEASTSGRIEVTFPDSSSTTTTLTSTNVESIEVTFPETATTSTSVSVGSRSGPATTTTFSAPQKSVIAAAVAKKVASSPKKSSPSKKMASSPRKAAKKAVAGAVARRAGAPSTKPEFSSDYQTPAKGPNPDLVSGPNLNNLIDDYVKEMGPNMEIYKGPDRNNVMGPNEMTGRDPMLASGPDPTNLSGPEPGLAKGSMYSSVRQC